MAKKFISAIILFLLVLISFLYDDDLTINNIISSNTVSKSQTNVVDNTIPSSLSSTLELYTVVRVVDGDTIKINYNGNEESVRLIGIDTPESVHPNANKNSADGVTASDFTKSCLVGKQISLEFDVDKTDKYNRLLAYVYLDDVMFNKTLLEEGYATVSTYPPNVKYVDDFTKLQQLARENKKGFWNFDEFVKNNTSAPKVIPETVYKTKSGSTYHYSSTCSGMKNAISLKLQKAKDMNLKPCGKCVN